MIIMPNLFACYSFLTLTYLVLPSSFKESLYFTILIKNFKCSGLLKTAFLLTCFKYHVSHAQCHNSSNKLKHNTRIWKCIRCIIKIHHIPILLLSHGIAFLDFFYHSHILFSCIRSWCKYSASATEASWIHT